MTTWNFFGYPPEIIIYIKQIASFKRRSVAKKVTSGQRGAPVKRFARAQSRKIIRAHKKRRHFVKDPRILITKYKSSILIDGFNPKRALKDWRSMIHRTIDSTVGEVSLKDFSFIENPIGVCNILNKLSIMEMDHSDIRLNFDDTYCSDIGAYLVLASIKKNMAPIFSGGAMNPAIMKVLEAVRLRQELGMKRTPLADAKSGLWAFPTISRRPAGSSTSSTRYLEPQSIEKVAKSLVEAINEWLGQIVEQELTEEGRRLVQKTVGEVLDNAERHSDLQKDGDWSISGFLAKRTDGDRTIFRCHLAFLSIGKTISETFSRADVSVRSQLDKYIAKHTNALNRRRRADSLATIFALQDGVTSDPQAFAEGRGGTGLQDVISFIDDLAGGDNPKHDAHLAIVSGNTHIRISHPYHKGVADNLGRRRLWLNDANSSDFAPDERHVTILPYRLNGTLVTAAFNLEKDYLENSIDD